jgi:hypothetical protein
MTNKASNFTSCHEVKPCSQLKKQYLICLWSLSGFHKNTGFWCIYDTCKTKPNLDLHSIMKSQSSLYAVKPNLVSSEASKFGIACGNCQW